jgi:hypothetical protein
LPGGIGMTQDATMNDEVRHVTDEDDAWPLVLGWVASAVREVELLPVEAPVGEATLLALQISGRASIGAIALRSAGIVVDRGWLRTLGAGGGRIGGGLREWNGLDGLGVAGRLRHQPAEAGRGGIERAGFD